MRNPYRVLGGKEVYRCGIFTVREDRIEKPNGTLDSFSVIDMRAGSTALPLTDDGQVYLIREYKYAIGRTSLEVASGGTEDGETPLQCAKRELREETGIVAREWIELGWVDPFTTQLEGRNNLFLARDLKDVGARPDPGEVIEVVRMPFAEACEMVMRGEITHAGSCAVILKAQVYLSRG